MELTKIESEIISGFLRQQWGEFITFAEGAVSESTLQRIAEKIQLDASLQDIK